MLTHRQGWGRAFEGVPGPLTDRVGDGPLKGSQDPCSLTDRVGDRPLKGSQDLAHSQTGLGTGL